MKKLYFLFLLIFCINASAQNTIQINDYDTGKPIGYTTIRIADADVIYYSNENGLATIPAGTKLFHISHICYKDTVIDAAKLKNNIIRLHPKTYSLPVAEVVSPSLKKKKRQEIGYSRFRGHFCSQGGKNGTCTAVYIPYDNNWTDTKYIYSIIACLSYEFAKIKDENIHVGDVRFDLRKPDSKNRSLPSEQSLINGGIIYKGPKKTGKKRILLENPIMFPKGGVFVVIEWIYPHVLTEKSILEPSIDKMDDGGNPVTVVKNFRDSDDKWIIESQDKREIVFVKKYLKGKIGNAKMGIEVNK